MVRRVQRLRDLQGGRNPPGARDRHAHARTLSVSLRLPRRWPAPTCTLLPPQRRRRSPLAAGRDDLQQRLRCAYVPLLHVLNHLQPTNTHVAAASATLRKEIGPADRSRPHARRPHHVALRVERVPRLAQHAHKRLPRQRQPRLQRPLRLCTAQRRSVWRRPPRMHAPARTSC